MDPGERINPMKKRKQEQMSMSSTSDMALQISQLHGMVADLNNKVTVLTNMVGTLVQGIDELKKVMTMPSSEVKAHTPSDDLAAYIRKYGTLPPPSLSK